MRFLRGVGRLTICVLVLLIGAPLVMVAAWLPLRPRQAKLGNWIVVAGARTILWALDIRLTVQHPERLLAHRGFLFPNHHSALDAVILAALHPIRFLGKQEIRSFPFIGWIAVAIDTVFVKREDKQSRLKARHVLLDIPRYPPIALFPEGKIPEDGSLLAEFRHGAFEIVQQTQTPYLPCVFVYEQRALAHWGDEGLHTVFWRMATRPAGVYTVEVIFLPPVQPHLQDDPQELAAAAYQQMFALLQQKHLPATT